jgi:branched-chain amino acid transport system substrate-binding protein
MAQDARSPAEQAIEAARPLRRGLRANRRAATTLRALARGAMSSVVIGALIVAAAPLAASGSDASENAGAIVVGSIAGTSGAGGSAGVAMVDGAKLAVADVNARGGVMGKRFVLESYDDQASATVASQLFEKLVSRGAVAVLGSGDTGAATAAMGQRLRIPDIGAVDHAGLAIYPQGPGRPPLDYAWSFGPNTFAWGASAARYAEGHCTALAILHDPSPYGLGGDAGVRLGLAGSSKMIVLDDAIREDRSTGATPGLANEIARIEHAGADCVVAWLTPQDTARLMRTIAARAIALTVIGNDEINADATFSALAKRAGDGAIGAQITSSIHPSARLKSFLKRFRATFHVGATPMAIANYDAVLMLASVIERAGSTDPGKLKDGFDSVKSFPGLQGTVTLSKQRHATLTERLLTPVRYDGASGKWLAAD